MKIVVAQFLYEANTFSESWGELCLFREGGAWVEGEAAVRGWARGTRSQLRGSLERLEGAGAEAVPVFAAVCGSPAGRLRAEAYGVVREALLKGVAEAFPADGLLLHLHGAGCAEGVDDVEGDLLEAVRRELGFRGRVVVSLDLHANVTGRMVHYADALTAYRTMPHRDFFETGERAADLILESGPTQVELMKLSALMPPTDASDRWGALEGLLARARKLEELPGVLDVSLFPVQPWLDVEELGCAVTASFAPECVGAATSAETGMAELARGWWETREEWRDGLVDWAVIGAHLRKRHPEGPWVLVDAADATSGGSAGRSLEALRQLYGMREALPGNVLLWVVDADFASSAAVGEGDFSIGSPAVRFRGRVVRTGEGRYRMRGLTYTGQEFSMGRYAVVEAGSLGLVVCSLPALAPDPAFFEAAGLDPEGALAVLAKSHLGWMAGYGCERDRGLLFDGPGATSLNLASLHYEKAGARCYPVIKNTEGMDSCG